MIEDYWNEVFGKFKDRDGKFNIPGFPEPLMSVHFGVKNIVGPTTEHIKQTFKICLLEPVSESDTKQMNFQSLNEAISSDAFWDFQKRYSGTYDFMQRLLPFLLSLPTRHYHFYLKDRDGITASALVGVANSGCFLFNLTVAPTMRNQGQARLLLQQMRTSFYNKKSFYWTINPWFTFDAVVRDYHLLN